MKVSSTTLVLATALGVAAHPSGHHGHAHVHRSIEKRVDFVIAEKPAPPPPVEVKVEAPAPTSTQAPPPPPPKPTTSKAAPAPPKPQPTAASSSASSSSGSGSGGVKPFCDGKKSKRASLADIAYAGNVGVAGMYGCNYMMVPSASGYKYTATFENNSGKDQKCVVWNKIGPDGGINGFWKNNQALSFDLPAGSTKILAADDNSQGGASCGVGSVPTTGVGQFANTWLEFDFNNQKNNGYSGADASCLVAAAAGMPITPLKVCGHGTCSTILAGGEGTNAYLKGMEAADGVGLNIAPGDVSLTVTIG